MSRPIKYRQLVRGRWYCWGFGLPDMGRGFASPMSLLDPSFQYTGLEDRNGVEIYEGDIVTRPKTWNGKSNGNEYLTVKWISTRVTNGFNVCSSKRYEVIGNTSENPELLHTQGPDVASTDSTPARSVSNPPITQ